VFVAPSTPPADLPPGLALAWGVLPEARRGPKPAHSVERIVAVAVDLADESGFPAVSMPKIANRLGVTANALYRYVASKEELVVLLADAGWGPPEVPARREGWRAGTPNMLSWLEVLLEALADTGLGPADKLACATLLDGYARSTANLARDLGTRSVSPEEGAAVAAFLEPLLRARGSTLVADLLGSAEPYAESTFDEGDVEFGLGRILDGIEVLIEHDGPNDQSR
jgi:AcrR family transcriptional regulator